MSLDLYEKETAERMMGLQPVQNPEASAFDGFARGTGTYTMRAFATAGRAASMALGAVPVVIDAVTGGTELQDKYFQWHDDVFGSAVDYWTPRPNEVGSAGQIVGTMLGTIPLVIAAPSAAVAATQMSVTEELARQGVSPTKAIGVGAVQGLGLGLGIYVPIFGKSLWQRTLLGGAGFNVVQGAAMRGASGAILEGTPAAEEYKAFDSEAMTLDLLLGAAFGVVSHLSPAQRAEGARAWNKLEEWGRTLKPSDVEGLAVLRQAQHANVDSLPGKPVEVTDVTAHTDRLKTAIEQLLRDEPVNVSDLPAGRFEPVPERFTEAEARAQTLVAEAERIRVEEGIPKPPEPEGPPVRPEPPLGEGLARPSVRKRVDEMTVEEMRTALLTDPLTGIKNIVAFEELSKMPVVASIDADGLKWVNDNMGHQSGNRLLRTIAQALSDETEHAFRFHGDEFAVGSRTAEEAQVIMESAVRRLQDTNLKVTLPDGSQVTMEGIKLSYGIGKTTEEADFNLGLQKAERERAGIRTPRGVEPPGVVRKPAPGQRDYGDYPAAEREKADPLALEASRFADDNPDLPISVGRDADGNPITKTVREYLDETRAEADLARQDIRLFEIAASCILGAM